MLNMYEIIELESKYLEYTKKNKKKKNFLYLSIGFCSILVVLFVLIFINFFFNQSNQQSQVTSTNKAIIQDEVTKSIVLKEKEKILQSKISNLNSKKANENLNNSIAKVEEKQQNNIQEIESKKSQSLEENAIFKKDDIANNLANNLPTFEIKSIGVKNSTIEKNKKDISNNNSSNKQNVLKQIQAPKEVFVNSNMQIVQSEQEDKEEELNPNIIITDSQSKTKLKTNKNSDIKELQSNYNETGSIYFAIELSKQYYLMADYSNARKWSIIANQKDKANEETWILFAKASYKLGQKEQALNALTNYNKDVNSTKVNKLIEQIKGNTL